MIWRKLKRSGLVSTSTYTLLRSITVDIMEDILEGTIHMASTTLATVMAIRITTDLRI